MQSRLLVLVVATAPVLRQKQMWLISGRRLRQMQQGLVVMLRLLMMMGS